MIYNVKTNSFRNNPELTNSFNKHLIIDYYLLEVQATKSGYDIFISKTKFSNKLLTNTQKMIISLKSRRLIPRTQFIISQGKSQ